MKPKIIKEDKRVGKVLIAYASVFQVEHYGKLVFSSPYLKKAMEFYESI